MFSILLSVDTFLKALTRRICFTIKSLFNWWSFSLILSRCDSLMLSCYSDSMIETKKVRFACCIVSSVVMQQLAFVDKWKQTTQRYYKYSSHLILWFGQTAIKLHSQHLLFWFGHMQNVVINSFFWTKYDLALIGQ